MKTYPKKKLEGKKIYLEPFTNSHVSNKYLNWMKDRQITRFIQRSSNNITLEDLYTFANFMIKSDCDYFFAIIEKNEQLHIGNVRLGPINFKLGKSNFGILIGDKNFHGLGIAQEALELLKDFGFNFLKLKKIQIYCVKENNAAMRIYEKSKCEYKGEVKETFDKDGKSYKLVEWIMDNLEFKSNNND